MSNDNLVSGLLDAQPGEDCGVCRLSELKQAKAENGSILVTLWCNKHDKETTLAKRCDSFYD